MWLLGSFCWLGDHLGDHHGGLLYVVELAADAALDHLKSTSRGTPQRQAEFRQTL
jgi:hypothetical protein